MDISGKEQRKPNYSSKFLNITNIWLPFKGSQNQFGLGKTEAESYLVNKIWLQPNDSAES